MVTQVGDCSFHLCARPKLGIETQMHTRYSAVPHGVSGQQRQEWAPASSRRLTRTIRKMAWPQEIQGGRCQAV